MGKVKGKDKTKTDKIDNSLMENRVIGIIGVGADKANWNADFDGNPNEHLGEFVSSPFCLKYAYRTYWVLKGLKVFFYKRFKYKDKKIKPMNIDDNLASILAKTKDEIEIQREVFEYIDVACFGGAFTSKKFNKDYTGAIQFSYGVNKYEESEVVRDNVISTFQNLNKEDSKQTTLGSRSYLTEGHFFYDFILNTKVNEQYKSLDKSFKDFTRGEYNYFKEASLQGVNNLNSVAKKGCYNEFAMFVELKKGSLKFLGNIAEKVKYYKNEECKGVIDLTYVCSDLKAIEKDIDNIEIYYNPTDTVVNITPFENMTIRNILNVVDDKIDFTELV